MCGDDDWSMDGWMVVGRVAIIPRKAVHKLTECYRVAVGMTVDESHAANTAPNLWKRERGEGGDYQSAKEEEEEHKGDEMKTHEKRRQEMGCSRDSTNHRSHIDRDTDNELLTVNLRTNQEARINHKM